MTTGLIGWRRRLPRPSRLAGSAPGDERRAHRFLRRSNSSQSRLRSSSNSRSSSPDSPRSLAFQEQPSRLRKNCRFAPQAQRICSGLIGQKLITGPPPKTLRVSIGPVFFDSPRFGRSEIRTTWGRRGYLRDGTTVDAVRTSKRRSRGISRSLDACSRKCEPKQTSPHRC